MTSRRPVPFHRRLGVRIFTTFAIVSLAAVLVTVSLLAIDAGRTLRSTIAQRNLQIASQAALEIGRIIEESMTELQAVGRTIGSLPYTDWIQAALLANVTLEFRRFGWARLVRADGAVVADSRTAASDEAIPADALPSALEHPPYVSSVRLSSEYTPSLVLGVRVRLADGSLGVLLAELRLRDLWQRLDEIEVSARGSAYVVSRDGLLLGHTDKRILLTPEERDRIPPAPDGLALPGTVVAVETAAGTMLTAYAPVSGRDWVVAVEQPIGEAFLPAAVLVRESLLLVAAAAAVSAAMGWLFSRRISVPLARLVRGTDAIAAGDLGHRIGAAGSDELGVLASSFDAMAAALQQRGHDLEASERKYRLVTERATDLIFTLDAQGRFQFASSRIRDFTGLTPEQVLARKLTDVLKSPLPEDFLSPAGPARRTRLVEITTAGGRRVPLEISLIRGEEEDGAPAWHGVGRDITERRQLEEQLFQAQKMEAVGRLAGGVAHDFNNLLTAILGYCEIARMEAADQPRLVTSIEQIQTAGRRAASLTRQLLAFSRRQVLSPQPLDLNRLLAAMGEMLQRLIGEHVMLTTRLAPDLGWIHADPGQIEQVVMNLCVNARDAMPEGGRIEIETAEAPEDRVLLAVRDNGTGMAPEALAHLFEPFFTTKAPGKGTGLGLSTAYGIVRQSGGDIACSSEPGVGTVFTITFPRVKVSAAERPAAARTSPLGGTETVLVVEDDAMLRELMVSELSEAGYRVLAAGTAEGALALVDSRAPNLRLLVTDLVLPGANGRKLAEELRRRIPVLAILMISGYTADTLDDYELLAGSTAFLQKPFLPAELLARARTLLDATA